MEITRTPPSQMKAPDIFTMSSDMFASSSESVSSSPSLISHRRHRLPLVLRVHVLAVVAGRVVVEEDVAERAVAARLDDVVSDRRRDLGAHGEAAVDHLEAVADGLHPAVPPFGLLDDEVLLRHHGGFAVPALDQRQDVLALEDAGSAALALLAGPLILAVSRVVRLGCFVVLE